MTAPRFQFRALQWGFLGLGLLLLGSWSIGDVASRDFQSTEARKLDAAALLGEGVLGRVEIPRLGIRAIVAEGTDVKTLGRAVGHVARTAQPGGNGNCALAGHRDSFFLGLGGARVDDVIRIVTPERTYAYRVEWTAVVEPKRVDLLDSTATRSLTLVTCYPFVYVGHAPKRFVVRASQVELEDRGAIESHGLVAEGR